MVFTYSAFSALKISIDEKNLNAVDPFQKQCVIMLRNEKAEVSFFSVGHTLWSLSKPSLAVFLWIIDLSGSSTALCLADTLSWTHSASGIVSHSNLSHWAPMPEHGWSRRDGGAGQNNSLCPLSVCLLSLSHVKQMRARFPSQWFKQCYVTWRRCVLPVWSRRCCFSGWAPHQLAK